jgi:truncated hemoglobin YjbI
VARDPVLRPVFPTSLHCAIEAFGRYLIQLLGGPSEYAPWRWRLSLREAHLRFRIGPPERDAWLADMGLAMADTAIAEPLRGALLAFFEASATYLVNSGDAPSAGLGVARPPAGVAGEWLARRWQEQLTLDAAVAALRRGDVASAATLAEDPKLAGGLARDRAALPGLLALMVAAGDPAQLACAHGLVGRDPGLVQGRHGSGRTLLHDAAGAAPLATVELLLGLGADPNAVDAGGHAPLYCLGNERLTGGDDVVRALVRAGAEVDAAGGAKRCTALHMAARRGNVEVACALLDCGATVDARDRLGDTPLRRAVNLGRIEVAELLLRRGADPRSRGSRDHTPLQAARKPAMRSLLERAHRQPLGSLPTSG